MNFNVQFGAIKNWHARWFTLQDTVVDE